MIFKCFSTFSVYDVLMVVVLIWQLIYTYRKMKSEEHSDEESQEK